MQILSTVHELSSDFGPSIVTLGNFDGVHMGHRELFRCLVQKARQLHYSSVVYTFYPHPLKFFAPAKAPLLLNTAEEKQRLIAASHVDILIEEPFNASFAAMSPEAFVDDILISKLNAKELVVGYDYAFGKNRRGNTAFLTEYGQARGVCVNVLQPVGADGLPYSSTRIRHLIAQGHVSEVVNLLGRHYTLEGIVVPGFQRGRQLGFPTANLKTDKESLPAPGVYAVKARFDQQEFNAVANLGKRPTFTDGLSTIEIHLLDFSGDLYGKTLRVYFVERLRDEKKFHDLGALSDAIADDVLRARQILPETRIIQYQEYLSLR